MGVDVSLANAAYRINRYVQKYIFIHFSFSILFFNIGLKIIIGGNQTIIRESVVRT